MVYLTPRDGRTRGLRVEGTLVTIYELAGAGWSPVCRVSATVADALLVAVALRLV